MTPASFLKAPLPTNTPPVLRMTYADIKTVKTRGVCQLVLEMPIEGMGDAFALLGAPVPGNEVWVAVARLREGATAAPEPEALPAPKKGTLAQQAGILCNEPAFQRYVAERDNLDGSMTVEGCAAFIRAFCGVESRADLDKSLQAGRIFTDLRADYKLWLGGDVVPA